MIDSLKGIAGFGIIAAVFACWTQIKAILLRIISIFIRTDSIDNDWAGNNAFELILKGSKIIRWGNIEWTGHYNTFIKKYGVISQLFYRKEGVLIVLHKGRTPIILKKKACGFSVTYLYKTFDFKPFMELAYLDMIKATKEEIDKSQKTYFYLVELSGEDVRFNSTGGAAPKSLESGQKGSGQESSNDNYFHYYWMKDRAQYIGIKYEDIGAGSETYQHTYYWSKEASQLREEVRFWMENAKWFQERGIPHCRSAILYGGAGTGKSRMTLQVAQTLGVPLRKINISNMSDEEFVRVYNTGGDRCAIILLEDIDGVFQGRTNVLADKSKTKNLLSFDTLINTIQGVKQNNGIFLILTSNFYDKLDPALVRAGRCDVKIEVGPIEKDGRLFVAKNILRDWPNLIDEVVESSEGMTVADFENKCIEIGKETKFKERKL